MNQQRLWAHIEPSRSWTGKDESMTEAATETKKRTRVKADPNDPWEKLVAARKALKGVVTRQGRAFENFKASWIGKRALALTEVDDETFAKLLALGEVNKYDADKRSEAIKARALQEDNGGETVDSDDLVTDDE